MSIQQHSRSIEEITNDVYTHICAFYNISEAFFENIIEQAKKEKYHKELDDFCMIALNNNEKSKQKGINFYTQLLKHLL